MSLLVVIPVCSKDIARALRNIEHCCTLDGTAPFSALISCERSLDVKLLTEAASRYFTGGVSVFRYDDYVGDSAWPMPQNNAFQEVARGIETEGNKNERRRLPWLFWESDAIPVRAGWISAIAEAHTEGKRHFSGAVTVHMGQSYVPGVAIYPWQISHYLLSALLASNHPWDRVASVRDGMLKRTHDITPLIEHTPERDNTHFVTQDDVARIIPDTAVLFHKCKDGSLLDVLQGRAPDTQGVNDDTVPSFTEQTSWECGFFTFPATQVPTCYFNCSIAELDGTRWILARRERYNTDASSIGSRRNDLAMFKVRSNMTLAGAPVVPATPARYPDEQWEDPRAIVAASDGSLHVAFATWVHGKPWPVRQSLTRLTRDLRRIEPVHEPTYGGNNPRPDRASGPEKNWAWFEHENRWHFVYTISPHVVVPISASSVSGTPYWGTQLALPWTHGEPRGGTTPIRVGDEYVCFFHSALMWRKPKRRYFMGAYTFSVRPPFELKRFTPLPLLTGSEHDPRALGGPLVIFPNGALWEPSTSTWLVVFGVNDEACGWIRIPDDDLQSRLVDVKPPSLVSRATNALVELVRA